MADHMNSILSSRKLIHAAGCLATTALVTLAIGIAFDAFPLALFSISASLLLLLLAVRDYANPVAARRARAVQHARAERMPLAA
jgi:hypothetical protein